MRLTSDFLQTPERAIQAFETVTGLSIVVHDLTSTLWPFLSTERLQHRSPCCAAVKATHDWACRDFEMGRLRQEIDRFPEGRYQCCHAGFLEWVVPVFLDSQLSWLLFAGQRRAAGLFVHLVKDVRTTRITHFVKSLPPTVSEKQAEYILESLRQLRSRLLEWHAGAISILDSSNGATLPKGKGVATRRLNIARFIYARHTTKASISDLAKELGLGEDRTIHLVKELFGSSYSKLINEMRLRTAASLLRDTSIPILEVCLSSGFQDLSHFHRLFRKRFAMTPLQYRRVPQG